MSKFEHVAVLIDHAGSYFLVTPFGNTIKPVLRGSPFARRQVTGFEDLKSAESVACEIDEYLKSRRSKAVRKI